MPFSQEMKELADKIFVNSAEPIRQRTELELQQAARASASRNTGVAGLMQTRLEIHEKELRELANVRLNSYKTVLEQAKQAPSQQDIEFMLTVSRRSRARE